MGVAHVSSDFEPVLGLSVGSKTAGETLVARVDSDTFVVKVACRCVERTLVSALRYAKVIFLTESVLIGSVAPAVGSEQILFSALSCIDIAESCIGIKLETVNKHILTFGNSVDIISEHCDEIAVGICESFCLVVSTYVHCIVADCTAECLVIESGRGNYIVILHGA